MDRISQLVRVSSHVVEGNEASDEFTVKQIVCLVDCSQAPKRVVVGILTETKWTICPKGRSLPVVVVMSEAVHFLKVARRVFEL